MRDVSSELEFPLVKEILEQRAKLLFLEKVSPTDFRAFYRDLNDHNLGSILDMNGISWRGQAITLEHKKYVTVDERRVCIERIESRLTESELEKRFSKHLSKFGTLELLQLHQKGEELWRLDAVYLDEESLTERLFSDADFAIEGVASFSMPTSKDREKREVNEESTLFVKDIAVSVSEHKFH